MKTKSLLIIAIIFLLLGWNTKDGVLFFFFAVHLFTLSVGVFCFKFDKKLSSMQFSESISDADSPES